MVRKEGWGHWQTEDGSLGRRASSKLMDRGQEYVGRDSLATYRSRGNRIIVDVFVTEILVACHGEIVEITCCFSRL